MKINIIYREELMSSVSFSAWQDFEKYILRFVSYKLSIHLSFESLPEQIAWYQDVVDLVVCVQRAQKELMESPWEITLYRFDQEVEILEAA